MTFSSNLSSALIRLATASNTLNANIGSLPALTTINKSNIVAALNEVKAAAEAAQASSLQINDATTVTDATWSSAKILAKVNEATAALINGADGAHDTLKELADQIVALAQADNGLLSFTAAQALTAPQQLQGCNNLGIGDPATDFVAVIEANLAAGL